MQRGCASIIEIPILVYIFSFVIILQYYLNSVCCTANLDAQSGRAFSLVVVATASIAAATTNKINTQTTAATTITTTLSDAGVVAASAATVDVNTTLTDIDSTQHIRNAR